MRVIVLNDYGFINGGAAQVAIASLHSLAMLGIDVTFVSSVAPVDSCIDPCMVRVINFGFQDVLTNSSRLDAFVKGIWNSSSEMRFQHVLNDFDQKDTIIHVHGWVKSLSSSVVHVAIKRRFRVVCTLHDYFLVCPNGGLFSFTQQKPCNLKPMSWACVANNCDSRSYAQKLWRVARQLVQNRVMNTADGVKYFISVSDYSEALLRPHMPLTSTFFRVRNPIDVAKENFPDASEKEMFTFVGRLSPEKGGDLFAAAAYMAGVRCVFVGSGGERSKILAINPDAEFLGWQDRAGVICAIKASLAVVFPSRLHETQGMVVLEAAALGVPAIVSDACAAKEVVINEETGLLFRSGDVDDLSNKLKRLNDEPEFARELGKRAYNQYWRSPCTMDDHVKELVSCFQKIMQVEG